MVSVFCFGQISLTCPVCPSSLKGVTNGNVLTDSSGRAVWQAPTGGGGSLNATSFNTVATTTAYTVSALSGKAIDAVDYGNMNFSPSQYSLSGTTFNILDNLFDIPTGIRVVIFYH